MHSLWLHSDSSKGESKHEEETLTKVINLYAGPGTGKSTTAAAVFTELKYRDVNCELVTEFAKDGAWEGRGPKFFAYQPYIFGEQAWRLHRLRDQVEVIITDSPLLMMLAYCDKPCLTSAIVEEFNTYDNYNFFLNRKKKYNPMGRVQTEAQSRQLDLVINELLHDYVLLSRFWTIDADRGAAHEIVDIMGY
jgi:nicotinamide riboside kinase